MTTALIVGGLLAVGLGLVASQLFRLKDWLARQPPPPDPADPADPAPPDHRPPDDQPPYPSAPQ